MENVKFDLVKITMEHDGVGVMLALPKFAEQETEECKKDIDRIQELTRELGHSIGRALEKYNPACECFNENKIDEALGKVIDLLDAAIRKVEK